jgi:hypothetical protein
MTFHQQFWKPGDEVTLAYPLDCGNVDCFLNIPTGVIGIIQEIPDRGDEILVDFGTDENPDVRSVSYSLLARAHPLEF